jgi:Zn-dependent protease with chaperone function
MYAQGRYSDGKVAGSKPVRLTLAAGNLRIEFESGDRPVDVAVDALRTVPPVGQGPWSLEFADQSQVVFTDDGFGRALLDASGEANPLGLLEGRWAWAIAAAVVALVASWAILEFGVPVAARHIAAAIPADVERELQQESLEVVDGWLFEPSRLPESRRRHVRDLFNDILATDAGFADYVLELRDSDIGANAFALPGGTVVVTDRLVELAADDSELAAVLAHEVGHLAHRHSLRILLQDSASAIFIAGVTGDLTNVTALSATIPTVLMQTKYSRQFEREADTFAFDYLESEGYDSEALSRLLKRIETEEGGGESVPGWLSTHPSSTERVRTD